MLSVCAWRALLPLLLASRSVAGAYCKIQFYSDLSACASSSANFQQELAYRKLGVCVATPKEGVASDNNNAEHDEVEYSTWSYAASTLTLTMTVYSDSSCATQIRKTTRTIPDSTCVDTKEAYGCATNNFPVYEGKCSNQYQCKTDVADCGSGKVEAGGAVGDAGLGCKCSCLSRYGSGATFCVGQSKCCPDQPADATRHWKALDCTVTAIPTGSVCVSRSPRSNAPLAPPRAQALAHSRSHSFFPQSK